MRSLAKEPEGWYVQHQAGPQVQRRQTSHPQVFTSKGKPYACSGCASNLVRGRSLWIQFLGSTPLNGALG